jgi:hypothetical protein
MRSKIDNYREILRAAVNNNYEFHTVLSFENLIRENKIDAEAKYLILRCDVDTSDFKLLNSFITAEKEYGARCSYYFRLSTINYDLMKRINKQGGEASYHYEEIATYCLNNHIKNKETAIERLPIIRKIFIENYFEVKRLSGLDLLTIASHGDFVNVKLGLPNYHIVDEEVRRQVGIIREVYDSEQMDYVTFRRADHSCVNFTEESVQAIINNEKVIYLLTHPAQWRADFWVNFKMNIDRIVKGLYY